MMKKISKIGVCMVFCTFYDFTAGGGFKSKDSESVHWQKVCLLQ